MIEDKRRSSRLPDRAQARGQADRRLRRAGQGQHAAQLLRRRAGLPRVHGRPEPAQAGPPAAGHAHPDPRAGGDPRGPARRRADPAVEPEGRDHGAARVHPRVGRASSPCRTPELTLAVVKLVPTPLAGAYVVELEPLRDERGFFARTFDAAQFEAAGLDARSRSATRRSTRARGHAARPALPGRAARRGQARALHARRGVRRRGRSAAGSPTVLRWFGVELRADGVASLLHPRGVRARLPDARRRLRGPLPDDRTATCPTPARGVRWDDPAFGIEWPAPRRRRSPSATPRIPTSRREARPRHGRPAASSAARTLAAARRRAATRSCATPRTCSSRARLSG